jgi:hypothetical protein
VVQFSIARLCRSQDRIGAYPKTQKALIIGIRDSESLLRWGQPMRRKVLQDFANLFCQRIIDLPSGYDLASFAHYGSGTYMANILSGGCSIDGRRIPSLRVCDEYKEWLNVQLDKHGIQRDGIKEVSLQINVKVDTVNLKSSYGHQFADAHFSFDLQSEIRTDEKSYRGEMAGEKTWGFDLYYVRLYGSLPGSWPPVTDSSPRQ